MDITDHGYNCSKLPMGTSSEAGQPVSRRQMAEELLNMDIDGDDPDVDYDLLPGPVAGQVDDFVEQTTTQEGATWAHGSVPGVLTIGSCAQKAELQHVPGTAHKLNAAPVMQRRSGVAKDCLWESPGGPGGLLGSERSQARVATLKLVETL
ncbi:unnamed protein product [Ostreobium quekettii]|uniref:Uncharacterized protein n=1 Tax=Ostreobium quekettii TaxID=121088 RepID=A0A8S1ITP1_9CHLO|nr:unnamed protein product [Ostreobium quekettii]